MIPCMSFARLFAAALLFVSAPAASAQGNAPAAAAQQSGGDENSPSAYDRIWENFTHWYKNDSNPVVQRVLFSGRYQHEYAAVGADQGSHGEWNVRRMRLGTKMTLFRTWTLHTEAEVNPQERDPFYVRLTDAYVQWTKSGRFAVSAGKQGVPFTMDGATSSKELLAIDRNNLTNNMWFPQEYIPGVSVSGKRAPWAYRGGVYSAGARNREFGEFSGGYFTLAALGYDFAKRLGVKEALLSGSHVYQKPRVNNTFTRQLQHVASANFKLDAGRWGLRTDFSAANGYFGQSALWGMMGMPWVNVTGNLQLVGRYTFLDSKDPNGIRLARYEDQVVRGRGDRYNEVYLGANYYFYGHKLKLQTGLQFSDMNDAAADGGEYSGVSWISGFRIGW